MEMVVRLDIPAIAGSLIDCTDRAETGHAIDAEDAARRMVCGYRFIDELLAQGRDPLAFGESQTLLELNHIVLCGLSPAKRAEHADHIAATRARFYGDRKAGAHAFYEWLARNRGGRPSQFVARLYVRIVSNPQLFIEGNQRTAALCASHALAAAGEPPLVVDTALAAAFAPIAAACRAVDRDKRIGRIQSWLAAHRLEALLESGRIRKYIIGGNANQAHRRGPHRAAE